MLYLCLLQLVKCNFSGSMLEDAYASLSMCVHGFDHAYVSLSMCTHLESRFDKNIYIFFYNCFNRFSHVS